MTRGLIATALCSLGGLCFLILLGTLAARTLALLINRRND